MDLATSEDGQVTLDELIRALTAARKTHGGDIKVAVWADHNQTHPPTGIAFARKWPAYDPEVGTYSFKELVSDYLLLDSD